MQLGAYLVGVAGGSGSGKTTLVRALRDQFPPGAVSIVSQDDYYLPLERQQRDGNGRVNWDLPGALDLDLLCEDLLSLTRGEAVFRREYHYEQDTEPKWLEIRPAPVVLVEGLFLLQHQRLRELFHLKVFVEASEQVQLQRRIARDEHERGYPLADVLYQWEHHVMPAYRDHLLPYLGHCDLHVENETQYHRALQALHTHVAPHASAAATLAKSA